MRVQCPMVYISIIALNNSSSMKCCKFIFTYNKIESKISLSRDIKYTIVHEHLKPREITFRLEPQEKDDRTRICKKNMAEF